MMVHQKSGVILAPVLLLLFWDCCVLSAICLLLLGCAELDSLYAGLSWIRYTTSASSVTLTIYSPSRGSVVCRGLCRRCLLLLDCVPVIVGVDSRF